MPNKKDYPKWFSVKVKPSAPIRPNEVFDKTACILNEDWGRYHSISAEMLIEKLKNVSSVSFEVNVSRGYYDDDATMRITGYSVENTKNPNYEQELVKYEESYIKI